MTQLPNSFVICSACGTEQPSTQQEGYCDNGWHLDASAFGYYGGFSDDFFKTEKTEWKLCHDCVVKFLELFPKLGEIVKKGSHNISDKAPKPCCKWVWRMKHADEMRIVQLVDDNGKWYDDDES